MSDIKGWDVPQAHMELSPRQESTRERLERRKKHLEDLLMGINKALELLNANPQLEEFHEALRRV